ncbi:hypothetical protein [Eggerthella sp. YY7918]|uniref:hypothetical protein n=1 Tax=Eggerthella sp. (strain YY7918) TaxID=502558 RepID=UPI001244EDBC|nr:hypothetical protein [Eggerthella sp. YY7918]
MEPRWAVTLKCLIDMWLPSLEVEAITYASYESATRMHILPALGGMLLPKITEFVLEEFFRRLPEGFVRV